MVLQTLKMFSILFVELFLLFMAVSIVVALINRRFGPDRLRAWLGGSPITGAFKGLLLGAITPFCSCSTLPMLVGMLNAGVSFGTAMTFLIASPLLNPIIIGTIWIMFGWWVTVIYAVVVAAFSLLAPIVWKALGLDKDLKRVVVRGEKEPEPWKGLKEEFPGAVRQAWSDLRPLLIPMILGLAVGAIIYGAVPTGALGFFAGKNVWWVIPIAAVIGIVMYVRLETVLPIGLALQSAGMALGPIFALMIGGAGASPPELSMLAAIFKKKLLVAFVVTILLVAIVGGYALTIFSALSN